MHNHLNLFLIITSFIFFSCEDIVSVQDISVQEIHILAPVSGAMLEEGEITLSWSSVDLADRYEYQVASPSFIDAQEIQSTLIETDSLQTTITATTTLNAGDYEWRVRAMNTAYNTNFTTASFNVVTPVVPLSDQTVVLLSPIDGLETTETSITFSWEEIVVATSYRLIISNTTTGEQIYQSASDATTQTVALEAGTYTWQVRAETDTASTLYSQRALTIQE